MATLQDFLRFSRIQGEKPRFHKRRLDPVYTRLANITWSHGYVFDDIVEEARSFFVESQLHHVRLTYGSAIAECLGLNPSDPEQRRLLWVNVADDYGVFRNLKGEWLSGQKDPSLQTVIAYSHKIALTRPTFSSPYFDKYLHSVKSSIVRTLAYIRLRRPTRKSGKAEDAEQNRLREQCWSYLKLMGYQKSKGRQSATQEAVDIILDRFKETFWLTGDSLGEFKTRVKAVTIEDDGQDDPYVLAWLIFKYSTYVRIDTSNFQGENPHAWLWDMSLPAYQRLWGDG